MRGKSIHTGNVSESAAEVTSVIEVTKKPISPDEVIAMVKSDGSGCVVTYVGLIRNNSHGKLVFSVEYQDSKHNATEILERIASEAKRKWQVENISITHRIGKLKVGDINLVIAVSSAHRKEGFAACQYVVDQFKQKLPTKKIETYQDGDISVEAEEGESV